MKTWMWIALGVGIAYIATRPGVAAIGGESAAERERLMAVQRVLRDTGYYHGPIDGINSAGTSMAAVDYLADRPQLAVRLAAITDDQERALATQRAIAQRLDR